MAETVPITGGHGHAKLRNPWVVLILSIITLGIYYVFWYYFINREMKHLGQANGVDLGDSPGLSVIAITIGALIIVPPFVSIWKTGRRMEGSQRVVGVTGGSGPLFFVLHIIPLVSLLAPVYMQYQLNHVWRALSEEPQQLPEAQAPVDTQEPLEAQRASVETQDPLQAQQPPQGPETPEMPETQQPLQPPGPSQPPQS